MIAEVDGGTLALWIVVGLCLLPMVLLVVLSVLAIALLPVAALLDEWRSRWWWRRAGASRDDESAPP